MHARRLLLPGALLLLSACSGGTQLPFSSDPLLGCFATSARKPAEFRIDKDGGQYFVSFEREGQWQREPNALYKASRDDIRQYFRDDAEQIDSALIRMAGGFGIFHAKEGASLKAKARDSDYMALLLIGAGPVYAVKCD
ncbi:TPA: hypothetical protein QDZ34_001506 [Stenotrophomonas maltophilia]|nr:hypothetical protein [Stenotrophomonas maltophilia]HDS1025299.1 hypothetical protein [Stenotrophomonas maltophilia]HDS1029552.1 hypothetical protein [Stenotrophomonas maltophilia]HDS1034170.1 hypothetical protein [Stenotrophomonas maltophilia]HDS1037572.1 hypothetical protein [Stenotrophomonas maltophilia]